MGIQEGTNSLIQAAKDSARGFRSTKNFIITIYLRMGNSNSFYPHETAKSQKKRLGQAILHAGQPVDADGSTGRVAPELDELLNGKDTSKVFHTATVLSMTAFQLWVSHRITRDPSDVGNAYDVTVQICLQYACAAGWAAIGINKTACSGHWLLNLPYPLVLTSVVFCRCSAWVYISVSTEPIL